MKKYMSIPTLSNIGMEHKMDKVTWDYRIVKRIDGDEETFAIHEAFYDENDNIEFITEEPVGFMAETTRELERIILDQVMKAFNKEVIDYDDVRCGE